jgi:ElaB/YqjD/DUF883 family membrane-anchored ribosome-binding protein
METNFDNPLSAVPSANGKINATSARAHQTIDHVSEAAHPALDRAASGAHSTVDKLAGVASNAAETISVRGAQLKQAQIRATESCRGYVRENPMVSVGIAAAVGFVLSRLFKSR